MTYTDTKAVESAVQQILNVFEAKNQRMSRDEREDMAQTIRQIIGGNTGLRAEDGEYRLYDITLIE